jgi:phosphoribosylaminoimidazole-succinocarboxamide synthase
MIFRTPRVKIEGSVESTQDQIILETSFTGVERFSQGKVRDVYRVGDQLLIVATDRISAFDFILPTGIPDKGRVLTQMSVFWFDFLRDVTATHFITADVNAYPPELRPFRAQLEGRSMLVKRAEMAPIECVARGYLAGSGWKEYRASGTVCDIPLPKGLQESSRLPEPIFTPATKAQTGHDENISFERMAAIVGMDVARQLRDLTLAIYQRAAVYAESRGIIIADTKFEFGFVDGKLVLGDEVLTPILPASAPRHLPARQSPELLRQTVRTGLSGDYSRNKQPPASRCLPKSPEDR